MPSADLTLCARHPCPLALHCRLSRHHWLGYVRPEQSFAMRGPAKAGWCPDMLPITPPDPPAPTDQAKAALAVEKARAGTP